MKTKNPDNDVRFLCSAKLSERLHFELKQHLAVRPRINIKGAKGPRLPTMDRFIDWVMLPLMLGKALPMYDSIVREERLALSDVMKASYDFVLANRHEFKRFVIARKVERKPVP